MKNVLTIAGYDPSGGAGIQADLKTFSALETYGISVPSVLTVQNTQGVFSINEIDANFFAKQLKSLVEDIEINAIKIGMLYSEAIIKETAAFLHSINCPIVVLDPVLLSKNGYWLIKETCLQIFIKEIFPLVTVVTPNIKEAQLLSNIEIKNETDVKKSAEIIKNFGPKFVLIKGVNQTPNSVTDILFDGSAYTDFPSKHLKVHHYLHGTGCTFASAITAELAKGFPVEEAIFGAQDYLKTISSTPLVLGRGNYNLNHLGLLQRNADKYTIIDDLKNGFNKLKESDVADLIPEVQSNLVFAMEGASTIEEVAGFPGRIVRIENTLGCISAPDFGKTKHMPRVILAVMHYYPYLRSAMNIKYSEKIIEACKKCGYHIYSFNRSDEPDEIKMKEGKTLDWGVNTALAKTHDPPDIVYDTGGHSKEPIVRVIGHNPNEVVEKIININNTISAI